MASVPTQRRQPIPPAPLRPRILRVVYSPDPNAVGRALPLTGEGWVVGREVEGSGRIEDGLMSRSHARVFKSEGNQYLIEDLKSRNGTFVDGERCDIPYSLSPNRVVLIGATLMVVDEEPTADRLPTRDDVSIPPMDEIAGIALATERMRRSLATVAPTTGNVLLLGPTGSGKEVAAKVIHRLSGRQGPFIAKNCAAIPEHLAEAELFGHTKGAFTSADREREGAFVQASGGTLFLDEIGDLAQSLQAKLLRVLEDGLVQPLGGDESKKVDVRVIGATNRELESRGFRSDLFARIAHWVLHLPPLADRKADVLLLFERFHPHAKLSTEAAEALLLHGWPRNIRDLIAIAQRLAATKGERTTVDLNLLPADMRAPLERRTHTLDEQLTDDRMEADTDRPSCDRLRQELSRCKGNVSLIARENGWHRTQVNRWLRDCGINPHLFR